MRRRESAVLEAANPEKRARFGTLVSGQPHCCSQPLEHLVAAICSLAFAALLAWTLMHEVPKAGLCLACAPERLARPAEHLLFLAVELGMPLLLLRRRLCNDATSLAAVSTLLILPWLGGAVPDAVMRMSMPDAMNWMAHKIKAKPGLKFEDVLESMHLRANQVNFKHVGENLMYKDFRAVLGDLDSPRIEVHSYCDIAVGRELLKISPEFVVFLPCRIVVMEDNNKEIWLLMLDWNMDWVSGYENQMSITPELANGAKILRDKMESIMRAGANGDL